MPRRDDRWAGPEAGQTLPEYGIVMAVIVLGCVGAFAALAGLGGQFQAVIAACSRLARGHPRAARRAAP
jgi:hypothetical protein